MAHWQAHMYDRPWAGYSPAPAVHAASARIDAHAQLAAVTVLLVPVHWVLGTSLLWGYMAAFLFFLAMMRFSSVEWAYSAFYAALVLGLCVAVLTGAPGERIAGAIYNLTIALVMLAFINCGRRIQLQSSGNLSAQIYSAAAWCFAIYIVYLACLFLYLRGSAPGPIEYSTLIFGLLGELPGVLAEYTKIDVALSDWNHNEVAWRMVGFGLYATEGAVLLALIGILASLNAVLNGHLGRAFLIEAAIGVTLVVLASRTTLGAYLLSLGLLGALMGRRVIAPLILGAPLILAVLVLAAVYGPGILMRSFEAVNEARAGSSGDRFKAYRLAITMVLDTNIWTGLGVKPREPALISIPIGSHSTFIGAFTKGGIIGLAMLAIAYLTLLAKIAAAQLMSYRQTVGPHVATELVFLSRCVLVAMVWWITEDFDAPVQCAAIAGLCIGLLAGLLQSSQDRAKQAAFSSSQDHTAQGWL